MASPPYNYEDIKKHATESYKEVGAIRSPTLCNNEVAFSDVGLNYIVRKNRKFRSIKEQMERFALLRYAAEIIACPRAKIAYRQRSSPRSTIHFWAFFAEVDGKNVKVVVNRLGNEKIQFLSIMKKREKQKDSQ